MSESESAPSENNFGHDYSYGFRSAEGYAVCGDCGARENTDKAARKCARLVFPLTEDWEIARRMIEDRARAALRQEPAAAPDDSDDEIIEGAEYWIVDPRPGISTSVLACVQDLSGPGTVFFTTGDEQHGYQEYTWPRDVFNLGRRFAAVSRLRIGATEKAPR